MTRSLWFVFLIAFCALCVICAFAGPATARADEGEPALPKYATKMMRFSHPNCGDRTRPSAFAPDGSLVVGCDGGIVQILDPLTNALLWQSPPDSPKLRHLAFPDANTLMVITEDRKTVLYDFATRTERARYLLPIPNPIERLHAAGGRVLVLAPAYKDPDKWTLTALSASDGKVIASRFLDYEPNAFALSPDGSLSAWFSHDSGVGNQTLRWNPTEHLGDQDHQNSVCAFNGSSRPESFLAFSSDNKTLALANNGSLCLHAIDGASPDRIVNGQLKDEFYTGDSELSEYEAMEYIHYYKPFTAVFSVDDKYLSVTSERRGLGRMDSYLESLTTYGVEVATGAVLTSDVDTAWRFGPTFAKVGAQDAVVFRGVPSNDLQRHPIDEDPERLPTLMSAEGNQVIRRLPLTSLGDRVNDIMLSPDGRWLSASDAEKILIWDTTKPSGRPVQIPKSFKEEYSGNVIRAFYSPDSAYLVTAFDQKITRWDLATKASTADAIPAKFEAMYGTADPDEVLLCDEGKFSRFSFKTKASAPDAALSALSECRDPAASLIAVEGEDTGVRGVEVIQTDTKKRVGFVELACTEESIFALSPDKQWLGVSCDQSEGFALTILHIPSGKTATVTPKPTVTNKALAFSPDSKTLISLHGRDRIFYWDLAAILPVSAAKKPSP